jgi:hypothetical protein
MKESEFDQLAKKYFGEVLEPYGFSAEKSNYCDFYRHVGNEVYHVVSPSLGSRGTWFDVKVFFTSPLIEPEFDKRFPNELGVPSDLLSFLHPKTGVGPDQKQYRCRLEEGFIRNFNKEVKPALLKKAIPYLDGIASLQDMLPYVTNPNYKAITQWQTGNKEEAKILLETQRKRLSGMEDDTGRVSATLKFMDDLLSNS